MRLDDINHSLLKSEFKVYDDTNYLVNYEKPKKNKKQSINSNKIKHTITNEDISALYGQSCFDKGLLVLSIILISFSFLTYFNYNLIGKYFLIISTVILSVNFMLICLFFLIFFKLRDSKAITSISYQVFKVIDILTGIYGMIALTVVILLNFQTISIFSFTYVSYILLFFIQLYYVNFVLKILNYSNFWYNFQNIWIKSYYFIKTDVLCMEEEYADPNLDYNEFDELDSEYY